MVLRLALPAAVVPRLLALAALVAGAAAAARPCYTLIDASNYIETTCATTLVDYSTGNQRIILRAYAPAAAHIVEAAVQIDPGFPFGENVLSVADYLFAYYTGVNSEKANLSSSLTAPFTVRPPRVGDEGTWVGAMALAPSNWPPASAPPAPEAPHRKPTASASAALAAWSSRPSQ